MTKTDLVSAVAKKAGVTKKDAGAVLDALIEEIIGAVKKGDRVPVSYTHLDVYKRPPITREYNTALLSCKPPP